MGGLAARPWENKEKGTSGVSWEVTAEAIGPDLTWATAKVTKSARRSDRDVPPPDDPWAASSAPQSGRAPAGAASSAPQSGGAGHWGGGYSDEPPF